VIFSSLFIHGSDINHAVGALQLQPMAANGGVRARTPPALRGNVDCFLLDTGTDEEVIASVRYASEPVRVDARCLAHGRQLPDRRKAELGA
jgi:hypothetical protein